MGINTSTLEAKDIDHCVKFRVRSMVYGFEWVLMALYGAAQPDYNPVILAELVRISSSESLHMLVGVFNIIQRAVEKTSDNFNVQWPLVLNNYL